MTKFIPKGPERFKHQKRGLKKMIETGGVTALLFDPGLGKTAVVLDYASILALKSASNEARVLVVAPLAAVDTWVIQSEVYVHDDVNVWAEAIGGSIRQRAIALSSRGGQVVRVQASPPGPPGWMDVDEANAHCERCDARHTERDPKKMRLWWLEHLRIDHPEYKARRRKKPWEGPRARYWDHAWARHIRGGSGMAFEGPDGLGTDKPRLIICVINLDTLATRSAVCRCHWETKCPDKRKRTMTMADAVVEGIRRFNPDLVVVDESHKIKGVMANASRVMSRVTDFVRRRVILTGTVMPHGPLDVFAQWRFLAPYVFGVKLADGTVKKATYGNFKTTYAQLGGWMGKEVIGYQNLDRMQALMAQNAVVARKEDSLDLPPLTEIVVPVHLTASEKKAYKDLTDNLYVDLPSGRVTVDNWLTQAMRLRQITSGHMPDDSGWIQIIGQSKVNTIHSLCRDTLTSEKRIVVFSFFTEEIDLLQKALSKDPNTEVLKVTGGTPVKDRLAMRKRFGSDDPTRMVLLAQVKTMSLAVNELVTSAHAIFGSLSQQRDDLIQAIDRINRMGQTRPMTAWFVLAPGTVDEVILKSHRERTSLEAAMLDHIKQVHEQGGLDNAEEQQGLMAHVMADVLGMAGFAPDSVPVRFG